MEEEQSCGCVWQVQYYPEHGSKEFWYAVSRCGSHGGKGMNELRERVAELCHEQWAGWAKHVQGKSGTATSPLGEWVLLLKADFERWQRQAATPYTDLSEAEKDSDRREADKFIAVFGSRYIHWLEDSMGRSPVPCPDKRPGCAKCKRGHAAHAPAAMLCNALEDRDGEIGKLKAKLKDWRDWHAILTMQRDHLLKRVEEEESANEGLQSISSDLADELKKERAREEERQWRLDSQRARIGELERDAADLRYKIEKAGTATRLRERLEEFERVNLNQYDTISADAKRIKLLEHDLANAQQAAVLLKESKAEALREEREKALKEECHCGERVREHTCPEAVSKLMNHHLRERMWRPIETAPKDGSSILIIWPRSSADASDYMVVGWSDEAWRDHHRAIQCSPTHWMPLPEPPR